MHPEVTCPPDPGGQVTGGATLAAAGSEPAGWGRCVDRTPRRNGPGDYLLGLVDLTLVLLAFGYVLSGDRALLVVWVGLALVFLIVGLVVVRGRSLRGVLDDGRVGALDTLSWVSPVTASVVGVAAAVDVLIVQQPGGGPAFAVDTLVGALAIIVAWALLHLGCAHVYQTSYLRNGGGLDFPNEPTPDFGDFTYFAFVIGTTFATSDVTVTTRRMRWIVLGHSVAGFFYNAVVIAVAIEVIKGIGGV